MSAVHQGTRSAPTHDGPDPDRPKLAGICALSATIQAHFGRGGMWWRTTGIIEV
jgi:hypothetical protein